MEGGKRRRERGKGSRRSEHVGVDVGVDVDEMCNKLYVEYLVLN